MSNTTCTRRKDVSNGKIDPYLKSLIQIKAKQLVGKCGLRSADIKDIEQALYLDFFERLPDFDPQKSKFSTFCQLVVERKISKILRALCTQKRAGLQTTESLDEVVGQDEFEDDVTLGDTIPDESTPLPEFQADVNLILDSLPQSHKEAFHALMEGLSMSAAARAVGVPRETFRDVILRDLRTAFKSFGKFE